jgi:hypothetical protein
VTPETSSKASAGLVMGRTTPWGRWMVHVYAAAQRAVQG